MSLLPAGWTHRSRAVALVALVWASVPSAAWGASSRPIAPLSDRVMDEAQLLTAGETVRLRQKLAAFERERKVQFVVATLAALGDESIEERTLAMAEAWKLGRRGRDDGLLLVVAPADHQARFEVGYGLEAELTDAQASRLLADARQAHPEGASGEGVIELASMTIAFLETHLPPPSVRRAVAEPLVDSTLGWVLGAVVVGGAALWFTLGRRKLEALPFRPLRPPPGQARGNAGSFRHSLLYAILWGWLGGGRGGSGSNDDRGPKPPQGGGGGFGGGGASGKW